GVGLDPGAGPGTLAHDRSAVGRDLGEAVGRGNDLALVGIVGRVLRAAGAAVDELGEAGARRPEDRARRGEHEGRAGVRDVVLVIAVVVRVVHAIVGRNALLGRCAVERNDLVPPAVLRRIGRRPHVLDAVAVPVDEHVERRRIDRVRRSEVVEHAVVREGQLLPEVERRACVRPGASEPDLDRRLVVRVRQGGQANGVLRRGGPPVDAEVHARAAQARAGAGGRVRAGAGDRIGALAQSLGRAIAVGVAADVSVPGTGAAAEADARSVTELARHLAARALPVAVLIAAARAAGRGATHAAARRAGVTAAVRRGTGVDAD